MHTGFPFPSSSTQHPQFSEAACPQPPIPIDCHELRFSFQSRPVELIHSLIPGCLHIRLQNRSLYDRRNLWEARLGISASRPLLFLLPFTSLPSLSTLPSPCNSSGPVARA